MNRKFSFALIFFFLIAFANAQQFGGFPPSTKWKQINSDTARIIFTQGSEWQAERIAFIVHRMAGDSSIMLGKKLRKINILLQSRTTIANGYVALGPFRSEFYMVPNSNLFEQGNLPWHEQLAIHEYRHVQQYNNFNNGLTKGFYFLFGEQGQAFANAITIPDWFFEGEAVHAETSLTPSGRGRMAYFHSGFNSLWLEGKQYSWQKLRNRSLKDYVPNHYQLGYLLTNYGYHRYGPDFWKKVTQDASRFKGVFYPFQKAIRRHAGVNYKTFRNDAFNYYRNRLGPASDSSILKNRKVTDYYFAQYIGRDSLLYLKQSYDRLPAFYLSDHGAERKIALQDISSEQWFSYREGKIAYTAFSTHPRWTYVNYSDIVILDINNGKKTRITQKERYYTPDISPSGSQIVAVKINEQLESELRLIDPASGNSRLLASDSGVLFVHPKFVDESRIVVGKRLPDARMLLQLFNLSSNTWMTLVPESYSTIGFPFVSNDTIYFTANFNGNDDVYAIVLKTKKIFQLTSGYTGNYFPSVFDGTLVWSHFTAEGMEWRKQKLNELQWGEQNPMTVQERTGFYPVAREKDIMNMPSERFGAKRYSKGTRLFNFHSWTPTYSDPEFTFSLYSDNILNTFSNQLFYRYNQNEDAHSVGWNTSYGGFFPGINGGVEYIFDRTLKTQTANIHYDQFEIRGGYNIPLTLTKGTTHRLLNFGSNYVYTEAKPTGASKDVAKGTSAGYLHHFVTWLQYLPMAVQHIYPRFGYTLSLHHRHRLGESGFQFFGSGQLFLPSVATNHSIVLQAAWQETDTNNVIFSNRFANSRGYEDYFFSRQWKVGVNYHFPIVYPDFGIAGIVYFQRLRGNWFYDYTRVYSFDKRNFAQMRSVGGELFFDSKWWNQLPVSFGLRLSYLLDDGFVSADRKGNTWFEFILPVGLVR